MLFAFVACNPNSSSSSSADDALLPGEVTPPAESERKSMSEADIKKVVEYYGTLFSNKSVMTEVVRERKIEVDFGESGTLSIKSNEDWEDSLKAGDSVETVTANGKITIGNDTYVVDNLVLEGKVKANPAHGGEYDYAIEKGSITKNGTAMIPGDAYSFLLYNSDKFTEDDQCKVYTEEDTKKTTMKAVDEKGKTIGTGTEVEKDTDINGEEKSVWVYDFTIDGSKIQIKMSLTGEDDYSIDYASLDGVFFDKASCDKLMEEM